MRKQLVVTTLAALALTAWSGPAVAEAGEGPQATLYSQFRYSLNYVDGDHAVDGITGRDNISVLGVKGHFPNGALKAFMHLQVGAYSDGVESKVAFKQRYFYGGFQGEFGKVTVGLMPNAYKLAGFLRDPFANFAHINAKGMWASAGVGYGLSKAGDSFTSNSLEYETPTLGGFKGVGGLFVDDSNENEHGFLGGGSYQQSSFTLGVIAATNGETTQTIAGIAPDGVAIRTFGTYDSQDVLIEASHEYIDTPDGDDMNFFFVAATVPVEELKTDLAATVGMVDSGPYEGMGFSVGGFYTVVPGAKLLALFSMADLEDGTQPVSFSLGTKFSFSSLVE